MKATLPTQGSAFLTKAELAAELHKSRRTIEIWAKAGYISYIRIGHSVLFDRAQVLADLRRYQVGGKEGRRDLRIGDYSTCGGGDAAATGTGSTR